MDFEGLVIRDNCLASEDSLEEAQVLRLDSAVQRVSGSSSGFDKLLFCDLSDHSDFGLSLIEVNLSG